MAISAGVTFFAVRKPIKTLLAIILLLLGPAYIAFDYFNSYRATIQEALPIKPATTPTSYQVVNDGRDDEIVIKGQLYGYARPGFKAWVLRDFDAILVYDETRGEIRKVEIRGLTKK